MLGFPSFGVQFPSVVKPGASVYASECLGWSSVVNAQFSLYHVCGPSDTISMLSFMSSQRDNRLSARELGGGSSVCVMVLRIFGTNDGLTAP